MKNGRERPIWGLRHSEENGFCCRLLGSSNPQIGNVSVGSFSWNQVYFSIWHQKFLPLRVFIWIIISFKKLPGVDNNAVVSTALKCEKWTCKNSHLDSVKERIDSWLIYHQINLSLDFEDSALEHVMSLNSLFRFSQERSLWIDYW